jgi:glutamine synthetase
MKQIFFSLLLLLSFFNPVLAENQLNIDQQPAHGSNQVVRFLKSQGIQFIDATWTGLDGKLYEITIPVYRLESALQDGMFFDGSSIKGFSQITQSDLHLTLDKDSLALSPWKSEGFASARFFCDTSSENDPRTTLKNVLEEAAQKGYTGLCGAEIEFFLFKEENGQYNQINNSSYCAVERKAEMKAFKEALLYALIHFGVNPEKIHAEVAAGQFEIVIGCCQPLQLADKIQLTKYAIAMFAQQHGYKAVFMSKPIYGVNGNGMHIHMSVKQGDHNLFFDATKEYYLSEAARSFISGVLSKAYEIDLLINPEVNSFKRLVAGYEAPVYLCCGEKNRSAAIRIPDVNHTTVHENKGAAVRIELRWPDASCNPYLALAALFKAGFDGIEQNLPATPCVNENLYHVDLAAITARGIQTLPSSLEAACKAFKNSEFAKELLGQSLHSTYLAIKETEWQEYLAENGFENASIITQWELNRGF